MLISVSVLTCNATLSVTVCNSQYHIMDAWPKYIICNAAHLELESGMALMAYDLGEHKTRYQDRLGIAFTAVWGSLSSEYGPTMGLYGKHRFRPWLLNISVDMLDQLHSMLQWISADVHNACSCTVTAIVAKSVTEEIVETDIVAVYNVKSSCKLKLQRQF